MTKGRGEAPQERVLYVLSALGIGGIETWLVNLVRAFNRIPNARIACDFLTLLDDKGEYRAELSNAGCKIFHVQLRYKHIIRTMYRLYTLIKQGGYRVVHCQSDYLSGIVLTAAFLAKVPVRVFHVHSTKFAFGPDRSLQKIIVGKILKKIAIKLSHYSFACSTAAREAFFLKNNKDKTSVLYCGIDIDKFESDINSNRKRKVSELGIRENSKIILSVSRMTPEKNLVLTIKAISALGESEDVFFLHAGDGPERATIAKLLDELNLSKRSKLLGLRNDVANLMLSADLFIMPSLYEGLPLVLLEAQAAGIPIIASNLITKELVVIPELFTWLSPHESPERWAGEIASALNRKINISKNDTLTKMRKSKFNINNSALLLLNYYGISNENSSPDSIG